jgi:hypothetical protein
MLTYAAYADVCCGMLYQIAGLASSHRVYALDLLGFGFRYSVYLLYWYKSTNTDTESSDKPNITYCNRLWGHQFTCFTGTKVQTLTQKAVTSQTSRIVIGSGGISLLALLVQKYKY